MAIFIKNENVQSALEVLLVFLLLLVLVEFNSILSLILHTNVPLAVISSTSMTPTLNVGDIVILEGVSLDEIKVGDIIVFNGYVINNKEVDISTPIIHRVVDIKVINGNVFYVTKGDRNPAPDMWLVPFKKVIGKVMEINGAAFKIPFVGYLSLLSHDILSG